MKSVRILSLKQVRDKTSLSRTSIWRMEKEDRFPKHRQLSIRRIGWVEEEIDKWLAQFLKSAPLKKTKA